MKKIGLFASEQMLSDIFVGKIDHKKIIINNKLMDFAFDKKIPQFFQDKTAINI